MVSVSLVVMLVCATILGSTNSQSYTDSLFNNINRVGRPGPVSPVVAVLPVEERRRPSLIGAISNGIRNIVTGGRGNRNINRGGRQQDVIVQSNVGGLHQIDLQLRDCEDYQQCPLGFRCMLNQFQDGIECFNARSNPQYVNIVINPRHIQRNSGGFGQGFNDGLHHRGGALVGGQRSSWKQASCCLKPRPQECIPQLGYGSRRNQNMISNDFWTFENGQCMQQPILSSFIPQIGMSPAYGNFYPSQRECFDKCDMYAPCFQPRPASCIPQAHFAQDLIANNFFRYDFELQRCEQTQILRDHTQFIGSGQYMNFFQDQASCMNTCPQDAWRFRNARRGNF